jgi:hypothetical protein
LFRLITNNAELYNSVRAAEYINGSSLDVLLSVRTRIHLGSILLTHPLCGNLRPNRQPFRSVIIDEVQGSVDIYSLKLIEEAVSVYRSCEVLSPESVDELTRKDYAYVDSELMRESLKQYGLITREVL